MFAKIMNFFEFDLWRNRFGRLSFFRSIILNLLRISMLSIRGFSKARGYLHASALTFYSLISIVPVIALLFAVARGFGYENILKQQLQERFESQQEVFTWIIGFAESLLQNVQGGFIAGVGVCLLLWAIIKLCGNIEKSFNVIWKVKKGRNLVRKFSDYLAVVFVAPVLFLISNSLTVALSGGVKQYIAKFIPSTTTTVIIGFSLEFVSVLFIWLLFTFLYVFIPNTRVKLKSSVIAGMVAGTIYIVVQWLYIRFQIGVSHYGAVYGSFAAVPLFLMWVQLSWVVVLVGASVAYSIQNVEKYESFEDCKLVSDSFRKLLAIRIATLCVKSFCSNGAKWTSKKIASHLEVPIYIVEKVLDKLVYAEVLERVLGRFGKDRRTFFYHPAKPTEKLTLAQVIKQLDSAGIDNIEIAQSDELEKTSNCLEGFENQLQQSESNILLREI